MSRRREAAELARVLALSTQEAVTISNLSPHQLSSSKSGSQDSKEMELRAVDPAYVAHHYGQDGPGYFPLSIDGMPPQVRTLDAEVGGFQPDLLNPMGSSGSDPISNGPLSHPLTVSGIQSFTPSRSSDLHSAPASAPMPPAAQLQSSMAAPSDIRATFSSPIGQISSSRPSESRAGTDGRKDTSSISGPLFSPTQTSKDNPTPPLPRPREPIVYGRRNLTETASAVTGPSRAALGTPATNSRSPYQTPQPAHSSIPRLTGSGPKGPFAVSDDDETEDEVEDRSGRFKTPAPPIPGPLPVAGSSRSRVEVVIPIREAPKSQSIPPVQTCRGHDSPDPLDGNLTRSRPPVNPPSSSNRPLSSSASARSMSVSVPPETQKTDEGSVPSRASRRVQDKRQKEEEEKEKRREARRIRKEKEAREKAEAEAKERAGASSADQPPVEVTPSSRKRARSTVEDEPNVSLETPAAKRSAGERRSKRTSGPDLDDIMVVDPKSSPVKSTRKAATPVIEPREDEGTAAELEPPPTTTAPEGVAEDEVGKEMQEEVQEEVQGEVQEEPVVVPKPKALKAVKAGKGKKAVAKGKKKTRIESSPAPPAVAEQAVDDREEQPEQEKVDDAVVATAEEEEEEVPPVVPEPEESPKAVSPPTKATRSGITSTPRAGPSVRVPLQQATPNVISSASGSSSTPYRASPGPTGPNGSHVKPGGIQWKTTRNDLTTVLSKFGGARQSGMSRKYKIAPLHSKIGTPAKSLPPVPLKPVRKKKGDESEEDDDEEEEEEVSDGEGGTVMVKKEKAKKVKGMEWYMVED